MPEFGEWFMPFMLNSRTYAFFEDGQDEEVFSFLIVGSERSILWDTGLGIGTLRERAEDLADSPVIVLNSHEHPDHIGETRNLTKSGAITMRYACSGSRTDTPMSF